MLRSIVNQFLFFLLLLEWTAGFAQRSRCGNPVIMENDCGDACIVCDLNGVVTRNGFTQPGNAPVGYCTQVVHSIRYLGFIAGSTNLSFNVTVGPCRVGNAIELGVYTGDCSNLTLVSNCNTFMPTAGTYSFSTTQALEIGCPYFIVVDGNGPADCEFSISVTSGSARAPVPTLDDFIGPRQVCVGDIETYTIKNPYGGCSTAWRTERARTEMPDLTSIRVQFDQKGIARVCASKVNDCHQSRELCIDIMVGEKSEPVELYHLVCPGRFIEIDKIKYYAGNYNLKLKNSTGCDSTVNVIVEEEQIIQSTLDTSICYPGCIKIQNQNFCDSGSFNAVLPSKIIPFCDSNILLNINLIQIVPKISSDGPLSCIKQTALLHADSSIIKGKGIVSYLWLDENNDSLSNKSFMVANHSGKYKLKINIITKDGVRCSQQTEFILEGNILPPDLQILSKPILCEGEPLPDILNYIRDINQTNSNIKYYKDFPLVAINEIDIAQYKATRDTSIIILFEIKQSNGFCSDTVELKIDVVKTPAFSVTSPKYCKNSIFSIQDLIFSNPQLRDSLMGLYFCAETDSSCQLKAPFSVISDSTIYLLMSNAGCQYTITHKINMIELPIVQARLEKNLFCLGEKIRLRQRQVQSTEKRKISFDTLIQFSTDTLLEIIAAKKGKYKIFIEGDLNGCLSEDTLEIEIEEAEIFPDLFCYSTDSTVSFSWKNKPRRFPFQIENISGKSFTSFGNDSIRFGALQSGDKIRIKFHVLDSICGFQSREIECEAIQCPVIRLSVNQIDSFCINSADPQFQKFSVNIDNPQNGYSGNWSGVGVVDNQNGIFDLSKMQEGTNKILFEYHKNTCKNRLEIPLFIAHRPKLNVISIDTICQDSFLTILTQGASKPGYSYKWNFDQGTFIKNGNNEDYQVKWQMPGLKKVSLKVEYTICESSVEKEIYVVENPKPATLLCEASDSTILLNIGLDPTTTDYKIEIDPPFPIQKLSGNSWRIGNMPADTECRIKINTRFHPSCGEYIGSWISCRTTKCPFKNLLADSTLSYCFGDTSIDLHFSSFLTDTSISGQWFVNGLPSDDKIKISDFKEGKYVIGFSSTVGSCVFNDTLSFLIKAKPQLLDWTLDDLRCFEFEKYGALSVEYDETSGPITYKLNGLSSSSGTFNNLSSGIYTLEVRNSAQCKHDTSFILTDPPIPQVDVGPDQYLKKGDLSRILPSITGEYVWLSWNTINGLSCGDCLSPYTSPPEDEMYILFVQNKFGCRDQDTLWIFVSDNQVWAPNAFSPNGDKINDEFTLFGSRDIKMIEELLIFDRWGEMVFSKKDFKPGLEDKGWDGTFRQKPVMPGTYVYIAKTLFKNNERVQIQGEIQLIR